MAERVQRWIEVTPSQFSHETEGLNVVRSLLPGNAPFRAWSNLEFRDGQGKWHEVDLLVLGRRRLHLVELKYYSGTLRGDDLTWRRERHRSEDSPLKLARRKAQRLASKLKDELVRWAQESGTDVDPRAVVPFVQESVFLHHPGLRCLLPSSSRIDLFGLDGHEHRTGLPGISERLLEPATQQQAVGANREDIIAMLMGKIGAVQRRQREAGSWVIDEEPLGEGEGWQDWPAFHRVATTERAKIRFYVTRPGSPSTERLKKRRAAEHEYRIMSRLTHDRLLCPRDMVDNDLGVGLVYDADERFQRLDLWLADQAGQVTVTSQLSLLRQVAEAVSYAHRNRVVHRGLTPHAVLIRSLPDDALRVLVGDWLSAGSATGSPLTGVSGTGLSSLPDSSDGRNPESDPLGSSMRRGAVDVDRRLAEAFEAPEGVWNPDADRIRLDVFALGALAYFVLSGRPPASDRAALRDRLNREKGLDLSADLPQVPSAVRALVLEATRPAVSQRLTDVRVFLERLAQAEEALAGPADDVTDPLEASPGAVIAGRFRLQRRLGEGSTAVGLLVTDLTIANSGPDATRVLKVAINDAAAGRLADEAKVLDGLGSSLRLVRLVEGPIDVGGRSALVLESAGDETLGEVLRGRERLSLDLLERWGTDLLEALVDLDRAGVDHRDIKPANLGVRERRGDRAKHLVLFDFSLSRAGATAVTAGTPPYLDPFLDDPVRGRYDSAAERYAAAVVLFEMATGTTPRYGDGLSDPASVRDEATVEPGMFDRSVSDQVVSFFRKALARVARDRYDTAADMLTAWRAVFEPVARPAPDAGAARAAAAEPSTPLALAGLSARALSALEPYNVVTVADLVAVDPVRLNRLSGVADATRREIKSRARQWREDFGAAVTGRGSGAQPGVEAAASGLVDPVTAAERIVAHAGSARAPARRVLTRHVLGLDGDLDPFASQAEIAASLGVKQPSIAQRMGALQESWATHEPCRELLDAVADTARQAVADLGGVVTVDELAGAVLAALPPAPGDQAVATRVAAGLLRLALDRAHALYRADAGDEQFVPRRRGGRIVLLATDAALLDPAEVLGHTADQLVTEAQAAGEPLVPGTRAVQRLEAAWARATDGQENLSATFQAARMTRLAAALAHEAFLSGSGDLYRRDLSQAEALGLALNGAGGVQTIGAQEIRDRVRAKFPALPPLPDRPRLDQVIDEAGLALVYDEDQHGYRSPTRAAETTGLTSRLVTLNVGPNEKYAVGGRTGQRLSESARSRSFLALGVDADRADRAVEAIVARCSAEVLDVTQVLIDAMRAQAAQVGLPWETVRAADAAPAGSRDAAGLSVLVQRSLPAVEAAIQASLDATPEGTRPLLLTELAPLARYDHLSLLSNWADLATRRPQAIWLLVPQLVGSTGALIDQRPIPLAAPGQFFSLDASWIDAYGHVPSAEGVS